MVDWTMSTAQKKRMKRIWLPILIIAIPLFIYGVFIA